MKTLEEIKKKEENELFALFCIQNEASGRDEKVRKK